MQKEVYQQQILQEDQKLQKSGTKPQLVQSFVQCLGSEWVAFCVQVSLFLITFRGRSMWLPSQKGLEALYLHAQREKYDCGVSGTFQTSGLKPVPLCDMSHQGCVLLSPQVHQRWVEPAVSPRTFTGL
eukprot:m.78308 g.78308  ORF g.78308 m.78308 type:complete len:128 (+) comp50562_c0_seq1:88-471(+)